jgi:hypothetical protein
MPREIEDLHSKYPILDVFGFETKEFTQPYNIRIRDENGNPMSQRAYRTVTKAFVNIDDLEQLIAFANAVNCEIIICPGDESSIEIYDTYRE